MQTFTVVVNRVTEQRIVREEEINVLCDALGKRLVYTVDVFGEQGAAGPNLSVVVESGRALVFFMDMSRGVKLCSRDSECTQRGLVSFANHDFPELELDQVEVHHRDVVSPGQALQILRHYLSTGEVIDLVAWPPEDFEDWGDYTAVSDCPGPEIPF